MFRISYSSDPENGIFNYSDDQVIKQKCNLEYYRVALINDVNLSLLRTSFLNPGKSAMLHATRLGCSNQSPIALTLPQSG